MDLIKKIKAVEKVFRQLEIQNSRFRQRSSLACKSNCGDCCLKNDIEATVLEFLPVAYFLYMSGQHEKIMEEINCRHDRVCIFCNPFGEKGFCSIYENRGLLCRLFGFACRTDKRNRNILVTCRHIKNTILPEKLENILPEAANMASYYLKLYAIDPGLSIMYYPLNHAIQKALEITSLHFDYKNKKMA
ncbi:MAG: YkgJ family cysteine cluster protein [Bacteroidales bacterium]|jgi:Fe-S-cluster containining protein